LFSCMLISPNTLKGNDNSEFEKPFLRQ